MFFLLFETYHKLSATTSVRPHLLAFWAVTYERLDCSLFVYMSTMFFSVDRTGKRSTFGLLKDGLNSSIRYYKNNFADGFRQVRLYKIFYFFHPFT